MNTSAHATSAVRPKHVPRGVILLVMLGLLALFTLIAVTFVVASGQFRRGASAAASAERMGDPFDTLLHQALMQVARGSNHPQSAIGPHSLLEDMYGNGDAVTGCCFIDGSQIGGTPPTFIYTNPTGANLTQRTGRTQPYKGMTVPGGPAAPMLIEIGAVSFGWDREPGMALADDNNNGVVDDAAEVPDSANNPLAGDDCFLGATYAHPAMVGEDPSVWPSVWQNKQTALPLIDNVENYYAGRVITFVNGDAAGQSAYIVRSKLIPVTPTTTENDAFRTVLYIQPFPIGAQPSHKDRFVINGRAFNGAGFGYNPYVAAGTGSLARKPAFIGSAPNLLPNPALRALDMPYSEPFIKTPANDGAVYAFDMIRGNGYPMSLLPNPVDGGYRDYLNRYNSIIDADEDYDAPDEQNMLLSYSVWVPSLTGSDSGRYRTIMPSLHRPDLVKYFTNQPGMAVAKPGSLAYPRWHDVPPHVRRRYILRPDPSDHYDWTQELGATQPQNSDGWTPGEPFQDLNNNGQWDPIAVVNGVATPEPYTDLPNPKPNQMYDIGDRAYYNTGFDAMDGPWDVDNDNDNLPDSIWVDLGAPVTTAPDGRMVKPMFAILVRDLDGRINVNAHGSVKHYDSLPDASNGYSAYSKPTPFQSGERVRMGNYAWSMYQTEPNVAVTTPDTLKVHTAGEPESNRDASTFRDVPFQGIWALPYFGDGPYYVNTPAYPRVNPAAKATYYDIYKPSTTTLIRSSVQDVDSNRIPDSPWYEEGGERKPVYRVVTANTGGPRPIMFDIQAARTSGAYDASRHIRGFEPAVGQGWSVCDVNLAQILQTGPWGMTRMPNSNSTNTTANPTAFTSRNDYRYLLEGVPNEKGTAAPRSGRYGESYLLAPSSAAYPGLNGPRAGATDALMFFSHLLNEPGTALPSVASVPPQRGDDNSPAAPSRAKAPSSDGRFVRGGAYRNAFMPVIAALPVPASTMTPYGVTVPLPADPRYSPSVFTTWLHGDFGTPGDPDGDGSVALDVNGQPVFLKMGTANEEIDDPTEINLHRRYFVQSYFGVTATTNAAGVPLTTDLDAPFAPAEMERVLRARDSASVTLPGRLSDSLRDEGGGGEIDNYDLRRSITTESWDVPCPHVAPTPELAAAMRALNLPLNNPSIVDLLRARFYLATGQNPSSTLALQSARLATVAMRSYRWQSAAETPPLPAGASADEKAQFPGNVRLTKAARKRWHTRLLSPDLGQGLRMDINAPFGNGFDDNNNGVVDEPMEWVGATAASGSGSIYNSFYFDGNRDGNFSINQAGAQGLDEEPRQQFAKELYCLMMLLIDQNYVEPLPTSVAATATAGGVTYAAGAESLAGFGYTGSDVLYPYITDATAGLVGSTAAKDKLRRWLTARRIAQWAINVVDFRDRDSIMTPFEFDADPFFDNDADAAPNPPTTVSPANLQAHFPNTNGTWDVDGYLIPTAMADGFDDTNRAWRGVVWGCEYPDLLLTETAAFHDRRTQNLTSTAASGTNYLDFDVIPNTLTAVGTGGNITDTDTSWDQRRVPQGTALFELYATGNPNNPALPRELYSLNPTTGNLTLDLARTVSGTTTTAGTQIYPVWRLAITQSHYQGEVPETNTSSMNMSIADRLREFPGTCSLELRDPGMSLVPTSVCPNVVTAAGQFIPIERVVTFVQNPPATFNAKAGLTQSKTTANITTNIDVFYFYTTTTNTSFAQVLPGDYVVVGPGRDVVSGPRNITTLGRTFKGTSANPKMIVTTTSGPITFTSYNQPQSIIDMGDPSVSGRYFLHTSVNGVDEYPIRYVGANPLPGLVQPTTVVPNTVLDIPTILQIRPPVSVPCMATVGSRRVGLNISEPLTTVNYYPTPTLPTTDDWDVSLVQTDTYAKVYDTPLDENTTGTTGGTHNPNIPHNANEYEDRTLLNFKTVFLQRLADPTRAWDQYLNPYLTIDWMPIDLTIFNGEPHFVYRDPPNSGSWKKDVTKAAHLIDPIKQTRLLNAHPTVADIPATAIRFGSRQRGAPRTPFRGNYSYYDLWSQPNWLDTSSDFDTRPPLTDSVSKSDVKIARTLGATPPPPTGPPVTKTYYAVDPVRWTDPFDHTFGYLNLGYHTMRAPTTSDRATLPMQQAPNWIANAASLPDNVNKPWLRMSPVREPLRRPFGGQNNPPLKTGLYSGWFTAADVGSNIRYVGSPRRPFNWLTWNNRPYAGSMELMLVPASSPGRLLHDYSMRITTPPAVPNDDTSNGFYSLNYAPFSARRAANHYMPPVRVPNNTTTSGHTNAAASVYAGTFMAGFISKAPYGHLLNFFESSNATGAGLPTNGYTQQTGASNYFRLFEFINVPSRMSGTRTPHYTGQQGGLVDPRFLYTGVYNTNNALGPGNTLEHPGWPFTVPYNLFSSYREPGRVNINTIIPLSSRSFTRDETSTNVNYMAQVIRNERLRDDGAGIWRSLVNDFYPAIRWLAGPNTNTPTPDIVDGLNPAVPFSNPFQQAAKTLSHLRQQNSSTISGKTGIRAGQMQASTDVTYSPYFFNPSEDTVGNFYSAYASMFKDDPNSDPRGPNAVYENWQYWNRATGVVFSDDRLLQPFWDGASPANPSMSRHDGLRPSMFSNPFRSFMSDFSATPPTAPSGLLATNKRYSAFQTGSANSNLPLLAVDSTLLRRRDTSWNPWSTFWLPSGVSSTDLSSASAGTSLLYSPAQIDPRFDPLFALNYPRPFRQRAGAGSSLVDIFSASAVPGAAVSTGPLATKPLWWSYSGYTSSLAHYIDGPEATSFLKYGTSATAPGIDGIRVKDSDYRNTDRNPFFRYQMYTKLSNTITTRSNVYAVWITVGYFECERVQPNVIYPVQFGHANNTEFAVKHRYPDGYRIIRELGSDNGETQRHRAFAILDRTIPVGFLRGENLNVDRCFLIKRIID